jgi:hypothetical protein
MPPSLARIHPRKTRVPCDPQEGCRECRDARCTRGLVRQCAKKMRTRAYRFSGGIRHSLRNGLTAYAALTPATNSSCHRRRRIQRLPEPVRSERATADLAPATGVRSTRFCRTLQRRSSCAPAIAHGVQPALRPPLPFPWRADALASTTSRPTFVTTRDRPSCRNRTAEHRPVICPRCEAEYFLRGDWTTQISLIWLAKLDFSRTRFRRLRTAVSGAPARRFCQVGQISRAAINCCQPVGG